MPGKVLAAETGRPLIQHVYEAASAAEAPARVVVATDDPRIADAVRAFGGEAVITREHPNGTSRLAEAADKLGLGADHVLVNVQGDEPELNPSLIDAAVERLLMTGTDAATVASPFAPGEDPADPNIVKVVVGCDGTALYFSRALVPHARDPGSGAAAPLKHVGLYAYRRGFLDRYVALPATPLERTEMLEQLRILENGFRIAVAIRPVLHHGIDTPEQYRAFVDRFRAKSARG